MVPDRLAKKVRCALEPHALYGGSTQDTSRDGRVSKAGLWDDATRREGRAAASGANMFDGTSYRGDRHDSLARPVGGERQGSAWLAGLVVDGALCL